MRSALALGLGLSLTALACSDGGPVSPAAPLMTTPHAAVLAVDHFLLAGASFDNGSCGPWADDEYNLHITVSDNGDGTSAVRTEYKAGSFLTRAGPSPSGCSANLPHGSTVLGGIKGKFEGVIQETVTNAAYNPDACHSNGGGPGGQASGPCSTHGGFILAVFGAAAIQTNGTFNFEYRSSDKRLIYSFWRDSSDLVGEFSGDIATS